jgi:hypothetical protein
VSSSGEAVRQRGGAARSAAAQAQAQAADRDELSCGLAARVHCAAARLGGSPPPRRGVARSRKRPVVNRHRSRNARVLVRGWSVAHSAASSASLSVHSQTVCAQPQAHTGITDRQPHTCPHKQQKGKALIYRHAHYDYLF